MTICRGREQDSASQTAAQSGISALRQRKDGRSVIHSCGAGSCAGVTYGAAKYLLLGCWAYAETIVDIRLLLDGKSVQFMKTDEYWVTDINNLDKLMNLDSVDYEGVDAVSYRDYLAILLIENKGGMYYRMADLIQLNFRQTDESFEMKNMMYSLTFDVEVSQTGNLHRL